MTLYEPETFLDFGKYVTRTLIDVATENAMYLQWCVVNVNNFVISDSTVEEIKKIYPKFLTNEDAIIILSSYLLSYYYLMPAVMFMAY